MGDAILKFVLALCALVAAAWPGLAAAQAPKPAAEPVQAPKPAAEPLGRLFFTPAQRAQLDVARTQRARTTLATEKTEEVQTTAAPTPQTITYDGVVRSSDGKSTVWINSRPVNEKETTSGTVIVGKVRADGGVSLQIPQSGRAVELKPGQSIELLSGTIEERYARKPAAPEPKPEAKPAPEARGAKPPAADTARAERERDDREQRRVDDAVTRAMQEKAGAKPEATTAAPAEPRR